MDLLEHPGLPEPVRELLLSERGAFLFGNTAPDVQTISRQPRSETHFFDLPLSSNSTPPWLLLNTRYSELGDAARLDRAQAVFLAGYLCHLQADWIWIKEIFVPVFGKKSEWSTFSQRLYLHNVLRSYLDNQILPSLTNGSEVGNILRQAGVKKWLPFVQDDYLLSWRDLLADQLIPGAQVKTVEVFAERQGIPPQEYYSLLSSEDRMENEVFVHLPRQVLNLYRRSVLEENVRLISAYLSMGEHRKALYPTRVSSSYPIPGSSVY